MQQNQQAIAAAHAQQIVPPSPASGTFSQLGSTSGLSTMTTTEATGGGGDIAANIYQQQLDSAQNELQEAKNKIRVLEVSEGNENSFYSYAYI